MSALLSQLEGRERRAECLRNDELAQLRARIRDLEQEVAVDDKLLAERDRLLEAIPACDAHGDKCIPHAIEWVMEQAILAASHQRLKEALERATDALEEAVGYVGCPMWSPSMEADCLAAFTFAREAIRSAP